MDIIYRICKVSGDSYYRGSEILSQDVMHCDTKEEFKEAMKLLYGDDIKFKHTKDMQEGDLFISIISYSCYNADDYIKIQDYKCANCGKEFKANDKYLNTSYDLSYLKKICQPLYDERKTELESPIFYCSNKCRLEHYQKLTKEFEQYAYDNDIVTNGWMDRDTTFTTYHRYGYIYMITKKSTGEFYVGQTNAIPMFRWMQHLKTERFKEENLVDYKFEVLERVYNLEDLDIRESYWIHTKRDENPKLSLNIQLPKSAEEMQLKRDISITDIFEEEKVV